jgi:hypothetical protein
MVGSKEKPPWWLNEDEYGLGLFYGMMVGIIVGVLMTLAIQRFMGVI